MEEGGDGRGCLERERNEGNKSKRKEKGKTVTALHFPSNPPPPSQFSLPISLFEQSRFKSKFLTFSHFQPSECPLCFLLNALKFQSEFVLCPNIT